MWTAPKIEANANRYTFVWGKAVVKHKAKLQEKVKTALGKLPKTVIADAGYGGEENYAYLESEELETLVKYSTYHKEKSKKWQQDQQAG
ncbi:hypothetical protein ACE3MQ_12960 [Paenibacillus lentus]|uniref:hypothetical protein n=1 Tax=Paenibacillus lentus TaxID=1338368 RepID=UPI00365897FC